MTQSADGVPAALVTHLRTWLGAWPPEGRVTVVGSSTRETPGWNGQVQPFLGVADGERAVLSVPPSVADRVRALGENLDAPGYGAALAAALGLPDRLLGRAVFRWTAAPRRLDEPGVWLEPGDQRMPTWLRPFNGGVLVAFDEDGLYAAGVGLKRHDAAGCELAVVTEAAHRGRGLARALVAQAARDVLARGAIPTYLHDPGNTASARTAEAAGFPDRGWSVYGLWYRRVP